MGNRCVAMGQVSIIKGCGNSISNFMFQRLIRHGAVAEWQVESLFPVKFSKNCKKSILLNLNKFVHLATVPASINHVPSSSFLSILFGSIAQSVEQLPLKQTVGGSSPLAPTLIHFLHVDNGACPAER